MRCPSCAFENIPGTPRCVRCDAALTAAGDRRPEDFMPPRSGRMGRLNAWLYRCRILLKRLSLGGPADPDQALLRAQMRHGHPCERRRQISLALLRILPGIVPGLPRFLRREWGRGLAWLGGWLLCLLLSLHFYPGTLAGLLLGLAVTLHLAMAMERGRTVLAAALSFRQMAIVTFCVLGLVLPLYLVPVSLIVRGFTQMVLPDVWGRGVLSGGDLLVFRMSSPASTGAIEVGDLVMAPLYRGYVVGYNYRGWGASVETGVIVVGTGGEVVRVNSTRITVNGRIIDPAWRNRLNLPLMPAGKECEFQLGPEQRLVIPLGQVGGMGGGMQEAVVTGFYRENLTIAVADVRGRCIGIWQPARHRRFFTAANRGQPADRLFLPSQ